MLLPESVCDGALIEALLEEGVRSTGGDGPFYCFAVTE